MADQTGGGEPAEPAPAGGPHPSRRPRVREVSSRFMSPLLQSPSNFPSKRGSDKPSGPAPSTVLRKPHNKENRESHSNLPDTTDRVVPSRYRHVSSTVHRSLNSSLSSSSGCAAVTAAARLLQEATSDGSKNLPRISTSGRDDSDQGSSSSSCPNSPLLSVPGNKVRADLRCSMSDMDKWLAEKSCEIGKGTGDCARSLNFSMRVGGGGVARPPHPSSCARSSGLDVRKGKKLFSGQQEDVHSLKMLSNHYLQWRFANAKAEASLHAQKKEAEIKLCSLGSKISDIRDNVQKKRNELAVLQRVKTLSEVLNAQMPYLDEWSTLEEDYSDSLSGMTNALVSSSLRLPVSGEVRADPGQLREALNSALKVVELIGTHIQRFTPKAEEMDISISELARMVGGEKALIEECGDLLSKTYSSQVNECSLRGSLMQLRHCNHLQPQKTETAS